MSYRVTYKINPANKFKMVNKKKKTESLSQKDDSRVNDSGSDPIEALTSLIQNINVNLERNTMIMENLSSQLGIIRANVDVPVTDISAGDHLDTVIEPPANIQKQGAVSVIPTVTAVTGNQVDRIFISAWKDLGGNNIHFSPEGSIHPIQFIKKLKRVFEDAGVPESKKVAFSLGGLRGSAQSWGLMKEDSIKDFNHFEGLFLERYWGASQEREMFQKIKFGSYENGSMAEYFLKIINESKYLTSLNLSESEVVKIVIAHFPPGVKRGILVSGLKMADDVEQYLREIDKTFEQETWMGTSTSTLCTLYLSFLSSHMDSIEAD